MSDSDIDNSPTALPRWTGWLLNAAYAALLLAVSPLLIYRSVTQGKYRSGWNEKLFGRVPDLPPVQGSTGLQAVDGKANCRPLIANRYWFHAVSVGEVLLLRSVLAELRRREPSAEIVISTTTSTGHAVAHEKFPDVTICYCPLDFTWAVSAAIQRLKPTQFVLVELELWPNIISVMRLADVPLSLINGRLSEHSFRGYSKLKWLLRPLLQSFDQIAVQNEAYAERFLALGATSERVVVTGSVKFDGIETCRDNERTHALREAFDIKPGERVFIAGSTQAPEEEVAIAAWQLARVAAPGLRLILVPRHKERFDEVAEFVTSLDLPLKRRSNVESAVSQPRRAATVNAPILLLDTLGELSACWGLADFAFVGGSLTNRGGQNMIEPAGYGAAVCFGPNTRNFRDTVEALLANDAATIVTDADSLATTLEHWIADPTAATAMGQRAQQFVVSQRGATARTLDCLSGKEPITPARRAA